MLRPGRSCCAYGWPELYTHRRYVCSLIRSEVRSPSRRPASSASEPACASAHPGGRSARAPPHGARRPWRGSPGSPRTPAAAWRADRRCFRPGAASRWGRVRAPSPWEWTGGEEVYPPKWIGWYAKNYQSAVFLPKRKPSFPDTVQRSRRDTATKMIARTPRIFFIFIKAFKITFTFPINIIHFHSIYS